ncbi:hypothetical protein [Chryseobacterium sp. MP_3.2]|uniref:hypothetical protein n=1 Tax=Chryseobacterium sp. MP_3.2 TaxID=3071712 RepID=UPI002E10C506
MKKYIYLAVFVVVIYFFQSFFLATGGIGADSLSYFGIAADFPKIETNLFPLGFPALIKMHHFIFQDYFWASKFLHISMVLGILAFSYFKKFYFRETVLLFTGKTLFFVFNIVSSEGTFVFLLYFLIYVLHQKLHDLIKPLKFVLLASFLMICLFAVRYSGIYIYLGILVYFGFQFIRNRTFPDIMDWFQFLALSGFGIGCYLAFNYFSFGSFTGEHLRGAPAQFYPIYIFRDLLGMVNVVDPFLGIKPASNSFGSIAFQVLIMIIDVFILKYLLTLYKRKRSLINLNFHHLLWSIAVIYTLALFVSGLFQQIEEMNVRMLAAANFCLFFSFLLIYYADLKSDKLIFRVGSFFLVFLTLYSLKIPENYLRNKAQIAAQMPKFEAKKYLFDNEQAEKITTTYEIPILKKSYQYQHTNSQKGSIKQSVAGTVNPKIKWLKYDTIPEKSSVLYTSELVLE